MPVFWLTFDGRCVKATSTATSKQHVSQLQSLFGQGSETKNIKSSCGSWVTTPASFADRPVGQAETIQGIVCFSGIRRGHQDRMANFDTEERHESRVVEFLED